jgi:Copper/zinc superoxide dismutase (SODC)
VLVNESGGSHVLGHLTLTQADVNSNVVITGTLTGLTPNHKHGLSVCVSGDISKGASTCGPIFNPFGKNHCKNRLIEIGAPVHKFCFFLN